MSAARPSPKAVSSSSSLTQTPKSNPFHPNNFFEFKEKEYDELSEMFKGVQFVWEALSNRLSFMAEKNKRDFRAKKENLDKLEIEINSIEEKMNTPEAQRKKSGKGSDGISSEKDLQDQLNLKKNKFAKDKENFDNKIVFGEGVIVEKEVSIKGPCVIDDGVRLQAKTVIVGPCRIGRGSIIGDAYLENVVVGADSEVHGVIKNSIVLSRAHLWAGVYISHGILGYGVTVAPNFSATNSKRRDPKTSGQNVLIQYDSKTIDTGLLKLSLIAGDACTLGTGSSSEPGALLAKSVTVNPRAYIRSGYYPVGFTIEYESVKLVEQMKNVHQRLDQLDKLEEEYKSLKQENVQLTHTVENVFQQLNELKAESQFLAKENLQLQHKIKEILPRLDKVEEKNELLEQKNSQLQQQVNSLSKRLDHQAKLHQQQIERQNDRTTQFVVGGLAVFGLYAAYKCAPQVMTNILQKAVSKRLPIISRLGRGPTT